MKKSNPMPRGAKCSQQHLDDETLFELRDSFNDLLEQRDNLIGMLETILDHTNTPFHKDARKLIKEIDKQGPPIGQSTYEEQ